jgi:hypothetical protein
MPKVIVAAQVKDSAVWEKNFRTHADVFRIMGVTKPVHYAINPGNDVAVCAEADDLDRFLAGMKSAATAEAMALDGVRPETVKMYVLDKEFKF